MPQAGIFPLPPPASTDAPDFTITSPATIEGAWVQGFAGVRGVGLQVNFLRSSGTGGVRVCIQSSMDMGYTYYDVYVLDYAATSRVDLFAVIAANAAIPWILTRDGGSGDSPVADAGLQCDVIGDRLRAKVFNTGTYSGTYLSVRANPIL